MGAYLRMGAYSRVALIRGITVLPLRMQSGTYMEKFYELMNISHLE